MNRSLTLPLWKVFLLLPLLSLTLAQEDPLDHPVSFQGKALAFMIAADLARQAGLALEDPPPLSLITRKELSCEDTLRACLERLLPGWKITLIPPGTLRLEPPPKSKPQAQVPKPQNPEPPKPAPPRYLLLAGGKLVGEGPFPQGFTPTLTVDRVLKAPGPLLDLTLSPLGPTCLVGRKDTVCLRPLSPNDAGELQIELDGKTYYVRYRVAQEELVLYRLYLVR